MRGESLEPGGCSACPTSPSAACTIAWAPPAGATVHVGAAAAAAPGTFPLLPRTEANDEPPAGAGGVAGSRPRWICSMRAMTAWTLIYPDGRIGRRSLEDRRPSGDCG